MTDGYVKFRNDQGLAEIGIGVIEFKCTGASPPNDHPHTYHAIGGEGFINCMYCNTRYIYRPELARFETDPLGNSFEDPEIVSRPNA